MERKIPGVKKLYDTVRQLRESGLFSSINVLKLVDEETVKLLKIKAEEVITEIKKRETDKNNADI